MVIHFTIESTHFVFDAPDWAIWIVFAIFLSWFASVVYRTCKQ